MKLLPAIALPLYALDQLTKRWVVTNFTPYDDPQPVIDNYFYLCRWHNTGAAFSIGSGNNWFFVVLSLVALAGLLVFHARGAFRDLPSRVGVALLIAGILGNLTDRLLYRHVVDFLLVDLHVPYANPWPAFNVADSCIFIATGCLIFASLRESRKPAAATAD